MRKCFIPFAIAFAFGVHSAQADVVLSVTVDTHTLAGTTGWVDFQFNPGAFVSQSASVKVQNFTGASFVNGTQADTGGASGGPLPGTITISNSTVFNDDYESVIFGKLMVFNLIFSGGAINAPNGTATSGSSFAFSMFDVGGTNPVLTSDPSGFAAVVNVNRNGSLGITVPSGSVSVTPEPCSWFMAAGGLALLVAAQRFRS